MTRLRPLAALAGFVVLAGAAVGAASTLVGLVLDDVPGWASWGALAVWAALLADTYRARRRHIAASRALEAARRTVARDAADRLTRLLGGLEHKP